MILLDLIQRPRAPITAGQAPHRRTMGAADPGVSGSRNQRDGGRGNLGQHRAGIRAARVHAARVRIR